MTSAGGPFETCKDRIANQGHMDSCVSNVCYNSKNSTVMKQMACSSMELYEMECITKGGHPTKWRRKLGCGGSQ